MGNAIWFWGAAYHYPGNRSRNATAWEEGVIDAGFQQLKEQYVDKGTPVLIGEFQAAPTPGLTGDEKTYNRASTLYWNKYLVDSAHAHGLSPFYWSTPNSPFDYETGEITDPEVVAVLTGGIAAPPPNGAPYAVTGLVAKAAGIGQVNLSWNAVAGATSYNLYRTSHSGNEPATPSVTGITGTSYNDTGLNDGTTYYYQAVAVNGSGPSGFSPEVHAVTSGVNPDPTEFSFETDAQHWSASGAQIAGIATSTAQHYAGNQSLAVNFNGSTAGQSSLDLANVVVPAGATVTFHVWVPAGHQVTSVEPYLQIQLGLDLQLAWKPDGWHLEHAHGQGPVGRHPAIAAAGPEDFDRCALDGHPLRRLDRLGAVSIRRQFLTFVIVLCAAGSCRGGTRERLSLDGGWGSHALLAALTEEVDGGATTRFDVSDAQGSDLGDACPVL